MANINRTFTKPPIVITQGAPQYNTNNTGRIYQVDEEEEEVEVFVATELERIFLGGVQEHTSVIIDTGSAYNLIGKHLMPMLKQRMAQAGVELKVEPTNKKFQFGGSTVIKSLGRMNIPIILGRTETEAEVYILESEIPFLIGG